MGALAGAMGRMGLEKRDRAEDSRKCKEKALNVRLNPRYTQG